MSWKVKFLKQKTVGKTSVICRDLPMVILYVTIPRHKMKVQPLKGEEVEFEELLYILETTGH